MEGSYTKSPGKRIDHRLPHTLWSHAVSYTHLDVYKRQSKYILNNVGEQLRPCLTPLSSNTALHLYQHGVTARLIMFPTTLTKTI